MKRDLSRIREILLKCEGSESVWFDLIFHWPGYDEPQHSVSSPWNESDQYQIALMEDAGLVEIKRKQDHDNEGFVFAREFRLTHSGHDYLDAIRDQGIWAKTKATVADTGGSATLEIVKSLAIGYLKKKISTATDIEL